MIGPVFTISPLQTLLLTAQVGGYWCFEFSHP
jgi:hypothetical protein